MADQATSKRYLQYFSDDPGDLWLLLLVMFDQGTGTVAVAESSSELYIAYYEVGRDFRPDLAWAHFESSSTSMAARAAANWLRHLSDEDKLKMCANPHEAQESIPGGYKLQISHEDVQGFMLTLKPAWV